MSKKHVLIITISVLASVIVIVGLPLVIDWMIIGNNFPSNISNSDWVGFLGGYIGSIMGCIISLVGILWTIRFTQNENRLDRELQVRPCFDIRYSDGYDTSNVSDWLGYSFIHVENNMRNMPHYSGGGILHILNIGNGPATNTRIRVILDPQEDDERGFTAGFSYEDEDFPVSANSIKPDKEACLGIQITNDCKNVPPEELSFYGSLCVDTTRFPLQESFNFKLIITCQDLMLNTFEQEIAFDVTYYMTEPNMTDGAKHKCEITMEETGELRKLRR